MTWNAQAIPGRKEVLRSSIRRADEDAQATLHNAPSIANFALLAALVGPKTRFGATFCEDKHDALKCMNQTVSEIVPVHNKTKDEVAQEEDKIERIAEKKVAIDEHGWYKYQAQKLKLEPAPEDVAAGLGGKDAGAIHRCRNCTSKGEDERAGLDMERQVTICTTRKISTTL